jgi:hypothetical protein
MVRKTVNSLSEFVTASLAVLALAVAIGLI